MFQAKIIFKGSGQVEVNYTKDNVNCVYWAHLDDKSSMAAFGTMTNKHHEKNRNRDKMEDEDDFDMAPSAKRGKMEMKLINYMGK